MAGGSYDVVVDERPAEAPAAPSPRVVELAGLNGATPLEALALRARRDGRDVGALVAHIFVALKVRRDEARDVCRICLGGGFECCGAFQLVNVSAFSPCADNQSFPVGTCSDIGRQLRN